MSMASRCRARMAAPAWPPWWWTATFDVAGLAQRLEGHLAALSRGPCFLRLQPEIEVTGTFKQRKVELVAEGFDPAAIADPLYWFDPTTRRYEKLTAAIYDDITNDRIKL